MTDTIARALAARAKGFTDKLFGGLVTSAAERAALQQALTAAGITAADPTARAASLSTRRSDFNNAGGPMSLVTKRGRVVAAGADGRGAPATWATLGAGNTARTMRNGRDVFMLNGPTDSATATQLRVARAIPTSAFQKLGVWFETPNVTAGNYSLQIWYSPDVPAADPINALPSNRRTLNLLGGDIMYGSRQMIGVDRAGKLYRQEAVGVQSTGQAWADVGTIGAPGSVSQILVVLVCDANVPIDQRWLAIDTVELDSYAVPLVSLGFDGTADTVVRDLFAKRNLPWYNAMDGNSLTANGAFMDDFVARGNEVVCNGQFHTNYGADASTLAADIDTCRAIHASRGWPMASTFAYPLNSRSAATDSILVQKGFGLARSFRHAPISYSQSGVPFTLAGGGAIINIGSYACDQQTASTMTQWVDDAILTGHGFNAYAHNLTAATSPGAVQTNLTEYITFLNYCQAKHEAGLIRLCLPREMQAMLGG